METGAPGTRERILEAALSVYRRQGARGFSMRAVAADAGITATAIYRHFPDKRALAAALVARARELLGGRMFEGLRGADSLERVWSCGDSYAGFAQDHPQLYRLLFVEPLDESLPDVRRMQSGEEAAPFRFVVDRMREAVDDGHLGGEPTHLALTVWAHLHGLCMLLLAGRVPSHDFRELCRSSLGHLYEGIKNRREP